MGDPHQVQQVFLNIINNARQAMDAHQPSGSIPHFAPRPVATRCASPFQDSGPGISREKSFLKFFDPFFTTTRKWARAPVWD